jgi:DNA-binding transcriptional ArsR family regulator
MLSFLSQTALSTVELAGRFGMSAPAVSRHLAILQNAGLVSGERQGQRVLYRLNRDALLNALARLASEVDGPLRTAPREAI